MRHIWACNILDDKSKLLWVGCAVDGSHLYRLMLLLQGQVVYIIAHLLSYCVTYQPFSPRLSTGVGNTWRAVLLHGWHIWWNVLETVYCIEEPIERCLLEMKPLCFVSPHSYIFFKNYCAEQEVGCHGPYNYSAAHCREHNLHFHSIISKQEVHTRLSAHKWRTVIFWSTNYFFAPMCSLFCEMYWRVYPEVITHASAN